MVIKLIQVIYVSYRSYPKKKKLAEGIRYLKPPSKIVVYRIVDLDMKVLTPVKNCVTSMRVSFKLKLWYGTSSIHCKHYKIIL